MAFDSFDLARFEGSDGAERAALADELDRICRETGFLLLRNHGVPAQTMEAIASAAQRFFDLPMADKQAVAPPEAGSPYGYLAPETETLAASKGVETPPDLKESFNGGPLSVPAGMRDEQALGFCFAPTPWPDLPGFRDAWVAYYAEMERLAERIMVAFAAAFGLRHDFFAPYIDAPVSACARSTTQPPTASRRPANSAPAPTAIMAR
ncbi:MAG: 2-oxoglutarate and iron-dependent oxygenase domain-containing protein [Pseudomonadota bacterium]